MSPMPTPCGCVSRFPPLLPPPDPGSALQPSAVEATWCGGWMHAVGSPEECGQGMWAAPSGCSMQLQSGVCPLCLLPTQHPAVVHKDPPVFWCSQHNGGVTTGYCAGSGQGVAPYPMVMCCPCPHMAGPHSRKHCLGLSHSLPSPPSICPKALGCACTVGREHYEQMDRSGKAYWMHSNATTLKFSSLKMQMRKLIF